MDALQIIIADKSQLLRLGIAGIIYQTGLQVQILEISDHGKFMTAIQKGTCHLIVVTGSFINTGNFNVPELATLQKKQLRYILINDDHQLAPKLLHGFDEVIENNDGERTILKKIEKVMQSLVKDSHNKSGTDDISSREKEVLQLVAKGLTNKEIAERLFISSHTVIAHRKNLTAKLGIKTIAGLTVYAVINKIIAIEDIK